MKKRKKQNNFWKIYGLVVGCVFLAILCGFFVFYSYMGAYEASQPQAAADGYLAGITEDDILAMAETEIGKLSMKYEDPDSYLEIYKNALAENKPLCQKLLTESTAEAPVYSVMCGEVEMCRMVLAEDGKGGFGFARWKVESCDFPIGNITDNGMKYELYVPAGASLKINGITPGDPSDDGVPCPAVSELETPEMASCTYYELGVLYREPEIVCTLESGSCPVFERDGMLICALPGSETEEYEITAPGDAAVYVNDVLLSEKYIKESGLPYDYSEFDASDSLPAKTVYATGELFAEPSVKVILGETELTAKKSGGSYTAEYPASLMYELTVKAPKGSAVTVNGKDAGAPASTERAFEGLLADTVAVPEYDVYTVSGLFAPAAVAGTLDGAAIEFTEVTENGKQTFTSDFASAVGDGVTDFAMDFVEAYFHYTSEGYRNTDANLAAALAFVQPNTELYQNIRGSKIGYDFVTPVTSEVYNQLEVTGTYLLNDGTCVVKIAFDVDQTIVYVNRNYAGEIFLHVTGSGDGMKISAMVIDNE